MNPLPSPQCRYGRNLRTYYNEWKRLSKPYNTFFSWLDKDRDATTMQCTRLELEKDTVEYLSTDEQRIRFMVTLCDNHVYSTDSKEPITTGNDGWIFVVSGSIHPLLINSYLTSYSSAIGQGWSHAGNSKKNFSAPVSSQ